MTVRKHLWSMIALSLLGMTSPAHAQISIVDTTKLPGATAFADNADINNQGQVLYSATVSSRQTLYVNQSGVNTFVAAAATSSPIAGANYSSFDTVDYNIDNSGRVTYRGVLTPNTNSPGLFRVAGGATTTVALKGSVPLTSGAGAPTSFTIGNYSANNSALTVFSGRSSASGTPWGIWSKTSGGVGTQLVAVDDVAPGISGLVQFNTFAFPSVDNSGNVSFFATFRGNPDGETGVFTRRVDGTISKIAIQGDVAGGVTDGRFNFFGRVVRNDANQTAMLAGVKVGFTDLRGVWTGGETTSTLSAVALQGQSVTSAAGLTAAFGRSYVLGNININGTGVFKASLSGAFTDAIFSFTGVDRKLLLAEGDSLFGSTISSLGSPSINDLGDIAVGYSLTNGVSGILVLPTTTVVPEANTVALFSIGISALGIVTRRNRKKCS